jgi:chromosome segregation ATPase
LWGLTEAESRLVEELQMRLTRLEGNLNELQKINNELSAQLESSKAKLTSLSAYSEDLKNSLIRANENLNTLKTSWENLKVENRSLQIELWIWRVVAGSLLVYLLVGR